MGRISNNAKKLADELERAANAGERLGSSTAAGSVAQSGPVTYNIFTGDRNQGDGRIGSGGSYGGKALRRSGQDDPFMRFLMSRGVTAKHQLENSQFIAVLRAEFERLVNSKSAILFRKGLLS